MNNITPLVSIVFTSYNHLEFLKQAIDSILNQSYSNFELIVIDDCSTDGSQALLLKYSYDKRVNLNLLESNSGSYVRASNYGAKLASGDYILFAQCDDFAEVNQLETLVNILHSNKKIGVAYSRSNLIDKLGDFISDDYSIREYSFRKICFETTIIDKKNMIRFLSYSCVIPNLSAALISRDLFNKIGGLSENYFIASDWDFWFKCARVTDFIYVAQPLNNFRQHETTIRSTYKVSTQIIEIYSIIYHFISSNNIDGFDRFKMKIRVGSIWFAYLIFGSKPSIKVFYTVFKETYKYEKLNILYLIFGVFKYIKEFFLKFI
uniref:glycosyltransferase n=1 Tax=Algoriphagus sp. TaxID=1872435 RepID=UPI004048C224